MRHSEWTIRRTQLPTSAAPLTERRRARLLVCAILLAAGVVRLGLLAVQSGNPERAIAPDTSTYLYFAKHLWGDMWSRNAGDLQTTLLRTPGYPLLLAALGRQTSLVIIAQIVMSLVLVVVVYGLSRSLIGEPGALIAASIVGLEPLGITYDFLLLSEVLFVLSFTVGVAFWLKALQIRSLRWLATAGTALGTATLVRPVSLYLIVVLVPIAALFVRKRALVASLVLFVAFALPVGTWIARNAILTGHLVFSTVGADNLANYRGAYAIATEDRTSVARARQEIAAHVTASDAATRAEQQTAAGIAALRSHPKGWFEETILGAAKLLLGGPSRSDWQVILGIDTPAITLLGYVISGAILAAAVTGGILALRDRQSELLAAIGVVVYIVAVSSGGESYSRMRLPVEPLLAILAAYAGVRIRLTGSGVRHRQRMLAEDSRTQPSTSMKR